MRTTVLALCTVIVGILLMFEAQAQQSVRECVTAAMNSTTYEEHACVEVHARVGGPGWSGKTKRASNRNCVVPAEGFSVVGAASVKRIGCIASRCRADSVEMVTEGGKTTMACLRVHTWSDNKSFGGGGSAHFRLCADVERRASPADILQLIEQCEATKE